MSDEVLLNAQKLLIELYKERNLEFERYGQFMQAPPTIEEALALLNPTPPESINKE